MLNINRFHILCFILWQIAMFYCCQQLLPIFYLYQPKRDCADANFHFSKERCKLSREEQCKELKNCTDIIIEKPPFHSMVEEFKMFCDDAAYDAAWVSTIQFLGVLVGTIVYGHLGDHFGRRWISIAGITLGVVFGVGSGFANTWQTFAVLRFGCGSSIACILVVFYTYILELILPEQRVFLRSFFNWGYARIVFTFVCYLCDHWRSAAMATAMLVSPVIPVALFVLPESPKWYATKGRYDDAKESERRIERLAGRPSADPICYEKLSMVDRHENLYTMKDLFTDRAVAIKTVVMCTLWFGTSLSAFGSDLNSGNLAGSFYFNQFMSALVTALAKIFVFVLDTWWPTFDRRRLHQLPQVLMILCYGSIMALQIFASDGDCSKSNLKDWAILIINIIGVSMIELTWDACYLVAVESFPTHIRTIGMGTCSLSARIGALLATQLVYLSNISAPAPYAVVCAVGILALIISLVFLQDTKGVDLSTIGKNESLENTKTSLGESSLESSTIGDDMVKSKELRF